MCVVQGPVPYRSNRRKHVITFKGKRNVLHPSVMTFTVEYGSYRILGELGQGIYPWIPNHGHYWAPTRRHELEHTDQESICTAWQI